MGLKKFSARRGATGACACAIFNSVVRVDVTENVTFEPRPEWSEQQGLLISEKRKVQAERTARAKALRQDLAFNNSRETRRTKAE